MDVLALKEYIRDNNLIDDILESLGCHHIMSNSEYVRCGNPDGDNKSAIVVYNNELLTTINYTRQLIKGDRATDIFDLISYIKECTFPESIRYVCNTFGIDYYTETNEKPKSLQLLQLIKEMNTGIISGTDKPLKIIPKSVLNYYLPYANTKFLNDGVSIDVQAEFGIGYDAQTNRITIPIYSPIGDLVGVKGRLFSDDFSIQPKFSYLFGCNKNRILYGLWENKNYIKNSNIVYVFESEKAVMQAASIGVRNCVATGGKTISKHQMEMLTRLTCDIVFAYDEDVNLEELKNIRSIFPEQIKIFAIYDKDKIVLEPKESPIDNVDKWFVLIKKHIVEI